MKRSLLFIPFIAFGGSALWLASVAGGRPWLGIACLSSFVLSLLAVPVISRKSLLHGYLAVAFVLLVLVIASVLGLSGGGMRGRGPDQGEVFLNEALRVPLAIYRIDIGRYPTTEEGLDALIHCPKGLEAKWKGPYLQDPRLLLDFWGRPHRYLCPGVRNPKGYDLSSMGPDGVPSGDDIGNWMK